MSVAARAIYPYVTYKATKSAMIAFTEQLAVRGAPFGVRANCILPGLIDTPMAVDTRAREFNKPRAEVAAERDARVLLRNKMGSAWTSPMARSTSPPTKRISSLAWLCRSTAAR